GWEGQITEDSTWKEIKDVGLFENRGFRETFRNFGWARKKVFIPSSLKAAAEKSGYFYLSVGMINDADQTFFNGRLAGETGGMPPDQIGVNRGTRLYKVDSRQILWDRENNIAVRIYSNFHNGGLAGGKYNVIIPSDNIFHATENTVSEVALPKDAKSYEASTHIDA